jgi:acetyl-CoA acetyltransferase
VHPYSDVAIAAACNTRQARRLEGHTTQSISLEAARLLITGTGIERADIDGIVGEMSKELTYALGIGPVWSSTTRAGIRGLLEAAAAIACGLCESVLLVAGGAGVHGDASMTAPWTRPSHEFVAPFGLYTAAHFAFVARRHMLTYGTKPEHIATVAATIRNNGSENPDAVYSGRGPFTAQDVLASPMIADPFHRLDCAATTEGGCAMLVTTAARARSLTSTPVYILGAGADQIGPSYMHPVNWEEPFLGGSDTPAGYVGRRAARRALSQAGLGIHQMDCLELYDPFSFEVIRQIEAFGLCEPGEGGDFVMDGNLDYGSKYPVDTDGGLMSYSHSGTAQLLQRVIRGVQQIQGTCSSRQVPDASAVLCSNGGSASLFSDVVILGREGP